MKYIMIYVCEKCGMEFRDEEECRQHEKTHVEIDVSKEITVCYVPEKSHPMEVIIQMNDGTRGIYRFYSIGT